MVLAEVAYASSWVGERVTRMEAEANMRVALLTRLGEGLVPHRDTVVQEGDLVHITVEWSRMDEVERVLEAGPTAGEH